MRLLDIRLEANALSEENVKADARAFAAVMRHLKQVDGRQHTVIMMQVENEAGVRPTSRDHCPLAEAAFTQPVPSVLMSYLVAHKEELIPELKEVWARTNFRQSGTWTEVFGEGPAADEVFQAWQVGRYIGRVAAAGKAEYPIPMYANAWLVQHKGQVPGQYPSGGPVARMMDVWRAAAPSIDFLAPDIYLDDFKAVCAEYTRNGNPLFIPEARRDDGAGLNALYALGHHHALGFSPFGIDSLSETNGLRDYYAVLGRLLPLIARHQGQDTLQQVARELCLSARTLQRRLTEADITFQQLVEDTRRELAHHYLKHSAMELNETAFLLGYEDANSFFRAFHGWEGTSPGDWRTKHRGAEPPVSEHSLYASV